MGVFETRWNERVRAFTTVTVPTHLQFRIGVILRAIDNHIIQLIQLLMSGGSTQALSTGHCVMVGFRDGSPTLGAWYNRAHDT